MDMITLAMVKAYTNSQRLAYTENNSVAWNGDETGKMVMPLSETQNMVLVSDSIVTADKVVGIWLVERPTWKRTYIDKKSEFPIVVEEEEPGLVVVNYIGLPMAFIVSSLVAEEQGISAGTYFYIGITDIGADIYVAELALEETIHPIDPKYIPALDALYLNGTDGKQYKVTVSDDGALTATEV